MLSDLANNYTAQELINVAQWLIAENTRKQMELVAELHDARNHNEHLAAVNAELEERVATLTAAYATLFGDAMDLAEIKQHMPMPFHMSDSRWCPQAVAAMCRSTSVD